MCRVDSMEPPEYGTPVTQDMLDTFSGYQNRFWYQRYHHKRKIHMKPQEIERVLEHPGTQPDIEIRW